MTATNWIKSEEAGYGKGAMLLDTARGHWSVRRANGRKWVAARVVNGIAQNSREFSTRKAAMEYAESN